MENYDIVVTDFNNKMSELLLDFAYDTFVYEYERNNTRQISFTAYKTTKNEDIFNMLQNEAFIDYQGQRYVIKDATASYNGLVFTKEITAFHIMYEFQNHFVSKDITSEELNDEVTDDETDTLMSLDQYLNFIFKDNKLGYSYKIIGNFNKSLPVTDLGDKNGIEHLIEGSNIFDYIFFADNKVINIYDHDTYYKLTEKVVRYRFNNDEVKATVDTKELKTFIKGYGKKKNKTETKNYSPVKPPDLTYKGKFFKEGTWRTQVVGASYEKTFQCKWGNETLEWSLKKLSRGGLIDVYLDDELIGRYSCYSHTARSENIVIARNLKKGWHTFKAVHRGADPNVGEYKTAPTMYVGTEKSTTLNLTAVLKGSEVYHTLGEYKSPNYKVFGHRQAPDVYDDKITNQTDLIERLKSELNDEPSIDLEINYIDREQIDENDAIWFIHEPLGYDTELRVVSIKRKHPLNPEPDEISFSNNKNDITKIYNQITGQIKNVDKAIQKNAINNIYAPSTGYVEGPIVGSVIIND